MDTEKHKYTVEVYDNATGEHYTRPANAEELAFYETLAEQLANSAQSTETTTPEPDETPSDS
jgi:hypothetical protein